MDGKIKVYKKTEHFVDETKHIEFPYSRSYEAAVAFRIGRVLEKTTINSQYKDNVTVALKIQIRRESTAYLIWLKV